MRLAYKLFAFAVLAVVLGLFLAQREGDHIYFASGPARADTFYRLIGGVGFFSIVAGCLLLYVASVQLCRKLSLVKLLLSGLLLAGLAPVVAKLWETIGPGFGLDNWTMLMMFPVFTTLACGVLIVAVTVIKGLIRLVRAQRP